MPRNRSTDEALRSPERRALAETPALAVRYVPKAGVRRLLLRRMHHHLYVVEKAARVHVVAVWSALRGRGPRLYLAPPRPRGSCYAPGVQVTLAHAPPSLLAAAAAAAVGTGKEVTITHGAALKNFQAPRVGKRFDMVVFGTLDRDG